MSGLPRKVTARPAEPPAGVQQRPIPMLRVPGASPGWRPPRAARRAAQMLTRTGRKRGKAWAKILRLAARGNGRAVRR